MNIGTQILKIRKEKGLTQEEFGKIFHVTRQGAGTGIVITCLFSADTMVRTVTIVLGVVMIGIGWYQEAKYDKRLFRYMNNEER